MITREQWDGLSEEARWKLFEKNSQTIEEKEGVPETMTVALVNALGEVAALRVFNRLLGQVGAR